MNKRIARVLVAIGVVGCGDNLRDPVGPPVVIDAPPAALSSRTRVEVAFHALGPAAGFTCSLDGAAEACESPWAIDAADGVHRIAIAAIGAGGIAGEPATASFTVETRAPDTAISAGPGAVETTAAATFQFAASPAEAGAAPRRRRCSRAAATSSSQAGSPTLLKPARTSSAASDYRGR